MNDDTEEKPVKPVLTLIQGTSKPEAPDTQTKGSQDVIDDSIEELRTFVNDVVDNLEDKITSPITGASIVLIHRDGGVSHGHSCSQKNLTALLGAMSLKIRRLESSYQKGD